jgi:hypothetical protein
MSPESDILPGIDAQPDLVAELDKALKLIERRNDHLRKLFANIGAEARCKCGATMWFIAHRNGKVAPYNADGETHFATCPHSKEFRKKK